MYRAVILLFITILTYGVRAQADSINGYSSRACNKDVRCVHISADRAEVSTDGSVIVFENLTLKLYNAKGKLERTEKLNRAELDQELNLLSSAEPKSSLVFDQTQMQFIN